MHSLSEDDWKIAPRSIRSRRRLPAFVRLPLCAIAAPPIAKSGPKSTGTAQRDGKPNDTEDTPEMPKPPAKPSPLVETTAKAWDRLRKALKDLEAMLPEKPPARVVGLPSLVAPLLEETEGILEDAIEFEERKRRKKARAEGAKRGNGQRSDAKA